MDGSVGHILDEFMRGDADSLRTKLRLLSLFSATNSLRQMKMARCYLDEILADLEAGMVSLPVAVQGVAEAAASSYALPEDI